jgi:hypothetical protein
MDMLPTPIFLALDAVHDDGTIEFDRVVAVMKPDEETARRCLIGFLMGFGWRCTKIWVPTREELPQIVPILRTSHYE